MLGDHAPKWLSGSYSFCAVDRQTLRIVALTDHVASSSVLYARAGKSLIVANQMGAMLAHPGLDPEPDIVALARLSLQRSCANGPPSLTFTSCKVAILCFTKVERFRPAVGGILWTWNRCATGMPISMWNMLLNSFSPHSLRTFAPPSQISVMMSGGLDSTLVAAVAATQARALGREVTAYTSIPEPGVAAPQRLNCDSDEIAESRAVVALHPNMHHVLVAPCGRTALDYLPRIHSVSHTAPSAISNLVWMESTNDQAQQAGGRIMLTGSNGNAGISLTADSVFGTLLADRRFVTALRMARRDAAQGGAEVWRVLARELRFQRDLRWPVRAAPRPGLRLLQPEIVAAVSDLSEQAFGNIRSRLQRARFITASKPFWKSDLMAQSGLDDLDPTADKRLIEALLSFPVEAFMAGGMARGLARQMGRGFVPDSVRLRRRRGEQSPEHAGLMQRHSHEYRAALRSLNDSPQCRSTFKLQEAKAMLDRLSVGVPNPQDAASVAALINVGLLLRERRH